MMPENEQPPAGQKKRRAWQAVIDWLAPLLVAEIIDRVVTLWLG
ncbi:hypothetical protein ACFUAG_34765 [Streptomyces sp. NPDC057193]|nr:hypothetical protein [Streptomyces sp. NBC_00094]MCX5395379.1 hypothetical protein [Streptomyces sp. NBC_00094]